MFDVVIIDDIEEVVQIFLADAENVAEGDVIAVYSTTTREYYTYAVGEIKGYDLIPYQ